MSQGNFAVAGLGVMGRMVGLNIERNGFPLVAYNRRTENADRMSEVSQGKNVTVTRSIPEMAKLLDKPRRVLIMTTAGAGTDAVIGELRKVFEAGDIIIDGGNAHFPDTNRRQAQLDPSGIHFIGCGISGGEQGALWGPSIMPGGHKKGYDHIAPVLTKIAAQTDDGPCVTHVGEGSAGHYVKMVHNGIEYGIMQIICEIYDVLRKSAGMSTAQIQAMFAEWCESDISGFLVEITADCLGKPDELSDKPLVEVILDTAGQKGTGKWTSQNAMDIGAPIPTINGAVTGRIISALKEERVAAAARLPGPDAPPYDGDPQELIDATRDALYASKISAYAQGMALLRQASEEYGYELNLGEIAAIWRAGCIIRARFLNHITDAYARNPSLTNLLLDEEFRAAVTQRLPAWRNVIQLAVARGIPTPAFSASLAYYDSYRSARLPANLIQAQRDYFGAHTYERTDREGIFHSDWE